MSIFKSTYKNKLRVIKNRLKNLISHVGFFDDNKSNLLINHKEFYTNEVKAVIEKAKDVIRKNDQNLNDEIYASSNHRENLIKAMRKYSRWRIDRLVEGNYVLKCLQRNVLRTRTNRIIEISSDGKETIFKNANQASKALGIDPRAILKRCKNSSNYTLSGFDGKMYSFKYEGEVVLSTPSEMVMPQITKTKVLHKPAYEDLPKLSDYEEFKDLQTCLNMKNLTMKKFLVKVKIPIQLEIILIEIIGLYLVKTE